MPLNTDALEFQQLRDFCTRLVEPKSCSVHPLKRHDGFRVASVKDISGEHRLVTPTWNSC